MEKSNGTISFLDMEIKVNPNGFETWTWRNQPTTVFSIFVRYICPKAWKEGLVLRLLHRAKAVCSSVKFFKTEVVNSKRLFMRNNDPTQFFNKISERFLHKLERQTQTEDEPDRKILFKILFAGKISKDFFKNISLITKRKFGIHVMPLYATTKVGHALFSSEKPNTFKSTLRCYL